MKPIQYMVHEAPLGAGLGRDIPYPIRVFTLEGLGINQKRFLEDLTPTFSILAIDHYVNKQSQVSFLKQHFPDEHTRLDDFLAYYYADRMDLYSVFDLIARLSSTQRHEFERIAIRSRRSRSISQFRVYRTGARWSVLEVPTAQFTQDVGSVDPRSLPRVFARTLPQITNHPEFRMLLVRLAEMVHEVRPRALEIEMVLHQMYIFADVLGTATNAPEGRHQDGAEYIVSALVMERVGVLGGESIVYLRDAAEQDVECLRHTLQIGEGLFQADKNTPLWHDVTPIREDPNVPPAYGSRGIFGFDINVVREE